jgi:transposase
MRSFDILWCWNFSIHRWKYEPDSYRLPNWPPCIAKWMKCSLNGTPRDFYRCPIKFTGNILNNTIVQLIEGGYRASEVANILNISKSTISKLLKRWRERGDTENKPRKGRAKFVSKRGERVLNRIILKIRKSYLPLTTNLKYRNALTRFKTRLKVSRRQYMQSAIRKVDSFMALCCTCSYFTFSLGFFAASAWNKKKRLIDLIVGA